MSKAMTLSYPARNGFSSKADANRRKNERVGFLCMAMIESRDEQWINPCSAMAERSRKTDPD